MIVLRLYIFSDDTPIMYQKFSYKISTIYKGSYDGLHELLPF